MLRPQLLRPLSAALLCLAVAAGLATPAAAAPVAAAGPVVTGALTKPARPGCVWVAAWPFKNCDGQKTYDMIMSANAQRLQQVVIAETTPLQLKNGAIVQDQFRDTFNRAAAAAVNPTYTTCVRYATAQVVSRHADLTAVRTASMRMLDQVPGLYTKAGFSRLMPLGQARDVEKVRLKVTPSLIQAISGSVAGINAQQQRTTLYGLYSLCGV